VHYLSKAIVNLIKLDISRHVSKWCLFFHLRCGDLGYGLDVELSSTCVFLYACNKIKDKTIIFDRASQ